MRNTADIIPWEKKYEIGHELIDSQHRIFLMLVNKLTTTIEGGVTKEYLFRVVSELRKYADFHFISEENVMHACGYPGTKDHERIHANILTEISELCENVSHGRSTPDQVVVFLKGWLFNHIALEDSHIAEYITEVQTATKDNIPDFIKWESSYETGNELIDSQHQVFVMLLNKFAQSIRGGETGDYVLRALHELKKYAEFHFISEENLMIECYYPDLIQHEKIHSTIVAELAILADHLANHLIQPIELVSFLRKWVLNHILIEDSRISNHIKNRPDLNVA